MYYRETSICISWIILCYCYILIFYISVIIYLFAGGYKCRLTTFPTRFAHVIFILRYCHCFALLKVLCHEQINKYHINITNSFLQLLFVLSTPLPIVSLLPVALESDLGVQTLFPILPPVVVSGFLLYEAN